MTPGAITGKTRVYGLIGDPVGHSMSPAMHNAAFEKLGLDYVYLPFRVSPEALGAAVDGLRALNVRGFNVTIPHKVKIIPLLDGLDPSAEKTGAVNTIVNNGGELRGYNTDAGGFLRALRDGGAEPAGNIIVLGAGGASRAVCHILAEHGASLTILNRLQELDWAEALAEHIADDLRVSIRVMELNDHNLGTALEGADILINATSVGMSPDSEATPVPQGLLRPGLTVFDIVYNPRQTRLLREAGAAGARTIAGVDMLAWQGALAFEKWTGQPAPLDLMRAEAVRLLEQHED